MGGHPMKWFVWKHLEIEFRIVISSLFLLESFSSSAGPLMFFSLKVLLLPGYHPLLDEKYSRNSSLLLCKCIALKRSASPIGLSKRPKFHSERNSFRNSRIERNNGSIPNGQIGKLLMLSHKCSSKGGAWHIKSYYHLCCVANIQCQEFAK